MGLNVSAHWKVRINGKEYRALDEVPPELRSAYEQALEAARSARPGQPATKISFDGREFESLEAMPPDLRNAYEAVLAALDTGEAFLGPPAAAAPGKPATAPHPSPGTAARAFERRRESPAIIEPGAPIPRWIIVGGLLLGLLFGLWYLTHLTGVR